MHPHPYTLAPYKGPASRHRCPACGRPRAFSPYISTGTGQPVHPTVGRCSREIKCGYHYTPRQFFAENDGAAPKPEPVAITTPTPPTYIPAAQLAASLSGYDSNHFFRFLRHTLGEEEAMRVRQQYLIGSSAHWPGATVFWQVDTAGNIRSGKVMLYHAHTGKRVKEPYNHIAWVHKLCAEKGFHLQQCFFGEHLLSGNTQPVALVESEKTAIIASAYLPKYIWLATGSLSNLNAAKCAVLRGREVRLYPDINAFGKWKEKAMELNKIFTASISTILEEKATPEGRAQGWDIADYLLQWNPSEFRRRQASAPVEVAVSPLGEPVSPVALKAGEDQAAPCLPGSNPPAAPPTMPAALHLFERRGFDTAFIEYQKIEPAPAPPAAPWQEELQQLKEYFANTTLPGTPVRLSPFETIGDVNRFVQGHLSIVEHNRGKETFRPYLERLLRLREVLEGEVEDKQPLTTHFR